MPLISEKTVKNDIFDLKSLFGKTGYLRKAGVEVQGATDQLGYQLPDDIDGQVLTFRQLNKR